MDSRKLLRCFWDMEKETKIIQDIFGLWLSTGMDLENCYSICPSPKPLCASTPGKAKGSSWPHRLGDEHPGPPLKNNSNYLKVGSTTDSPFQEQQINPPPNGTLLSCTTTCKWSSGMAGWRSRRGGSWGQRGIGSCLNSISSPTLLSKKFFLLKRVH